MTEAAATGLTIDACVARLKRVHWSLRRLHQIFIARITATPVYELKMAFSLHGHYCAEHVAACRTRVREMRQPPYGLDAAPDAALDAFFDEILMAPNVEALVLGLYEKAIPLVVAALEGLIRDTNRLFDHPTYRLCRLALVEVADISAYGREAIRCVVEASTRAQLADWLLTLDRQITMSGGLDGTGGEPAAKDAVIPRVFGGRPFVYDGVPQRDERFQDPYNMGVNAEAFLLDPAVPAKPKTLMLYFKRLREIDVPEMMSSIITETRGKPWEYYRDMTRQLWDEARHAMMGELGFVAIGIDWTQIPINFTWSMGLNEKLDPKERHAVLFTIEQGLMPKKTGKEYEWEVAVASADPLSKLVQDYDWADEILHARIGRDWLVKEFPGQAEALAFGSECWSRTLTDWGAWRDQGLTEHRNWWPEIYGQACARWGVEPDAKLLAYDTTYEGKRPDLKAV
jgi:hypothetical protein